MSLFDNLDALLPGLLPASYRGVPFYMPNSDHSVGRRIILTHFPGVDTPAADDLGRADGPWSLAGLLIGDDYIAQAAAMERAFATPGPATLMHPWLGERTVLPEAGGCTIHFAANGLRLARLDLSVTPVTISFGASVSTIALVVAAIGALLTAARAAATAVLTPAASGVATRYEAHVTAEAVSTAISTAITAAPWSAALAADMAAGYAAIAAAVAIDTDGATGAAALAAALTALPAPISATAIATPTPAISAGGDYEAPDPPLTTRQAAAQLIALAATVRAIDAYNTLAAAVRLTAEVALLAEAARAVVEIDFESRQEAETYAWAITAALDEAAGDVADLAPDAPAPMATLWSVVGTLRAALGRDLHETVGRLPSVRVIRPPYGCSAWLIAQHFAGDDPTKVIPMLDDIVRRNRLRHPGMITAETIEVLM